MEANMIPPRSAVPEQDRWNLSKLFPDDRSWEEGLGRLEAMIPRIESFRGTLGESAGTLHACLSFMNEYGMLEERVGYYAHLRMSEDAGDGANQARFARFMSAASRGEAAASYQAPEIQAIPDDRMAAFLEDPLLEDFRISLRKLLRFKPHILSENEERILALQEEANQTPQKSFGALTDVDMDFGEIETPDGKKPLSQGSYSSFLLDPDREVRRRAYEQFMGRYDGFRNTISALYAGSVLQDKYKAQVRHYPSARAMKLFSDDVPEAVYDNLIAQVHEALPLLHRYYGIRKRALDVDRLRLYDVKVPLVPDIQVRHRFDEAVDKVLQALAPLGDEYMQRSRERTPRRLGRQVREQGQALRGLLFRFLRRGSLHPDEFQGRRSARCVHPGARGRSFDAFLVQRPEQSLPALSLHHLRS